MASMAVEHNPMIQNDWVMISLELSDLNISDKSQKKSDLVSGLPLLVQALSSESLQQQLEATISLRKILSMESDSTSIPDVVNAGAVPPLVECLRRTDAPNLQFEAAWALTNIASGSTETTTWLVGQGVVPIFVQLLSCPDADVNEQAVWALGNIAGDSPHMRDVVLSHNALPSLLNLIGSGQLRLTSLRTGAWMLSNLLRGTPRVPKSVVALALPTLARLVHCVDDEVLSDALWALSFATEGTNDWIQAAIEAGVVPRVVQLLSNDSVLVPALRTVGNIASGDDHQTQTLIDGAVLPHLARLLSSDKTKVRKETCWALSNVTAGNAQQIEDVIKTDGLVQGLIHLASTSGWDVRKEALWAVSNATSTGRDAHIQYLVEQGCLAAFVANLCCRDACILHATLEGIQNVLNVGEKLKVLHSLGYNPFDATLNQLEAAPRLMELMQREDGHQSAAGLRSLPAVRELASKLVHEHLGQCQLLPAVRAQIQMQTEDMEEMQKMEQEEEEEDGEEGEEEEEEEEEEDEEDW
eukprot:2295102-Rhodomonas_salina.2